MLVENMTLRQMIDFTPREDEMFSLPIDVICYLKVSIVSYAKQTNYDFIRFLFQDEEISNYFKEYESTKFFDFNGTETTQSRFVTIFELNSLYNYASTSIYLESMLQKYNHEADIIIDVFTHDDKAYRISDLDSIIKIEELINKSR